jgi:YfiH family protein
MKSDRLNTLHPDWLIPDWPAPAGVHAVFTTRHGGSSAAPYNSMNLGDHVGDAPQQVAANRDLLGQALAATPVFLQQVHGTDVLLLDADSAQGQQADAVVTAQQGLVCTIMVADCLPVLLCSQAGSVIAAAHAGWRGLAGMQGEGVLEAVFGTFSAVAANTPRQAGAKTLAWLGPCIGPSAFEVGAEVKAVFTAHDASAEAFFQPQADGKYLADLPGLARLRLQALGITEIYGNDGSLPWCTVSNGSRFFSHRRDAGFTGNGWRTTGRMAACIWHD